jgi:hypothetical protein
MAQSGINAALPLDAAASLAQQQQVAHLPIQLYPKAAMPLSTMACAVWRICLS